jgi:hypothetical protein
MFRANVRMLKGMGSVPSKNEDLLNTRLKRKISRKQGKLYAHT